MNIYNKNNHKIILNSTKSVYDEYVEKRPITTLEYIAYVEKLAKAVVIDLETEVTERKSADEEELNARELVDSELQHDIDNHTNNKENPHETSFDLLKTKPNPLINAEQEEGTSKLTFTFYNGETEVYVPTTSGVAWGNITGSIELQNDLKEKLDNLNTSDELLQNAIDDEQIRAVASENEIKNIKQNKYEEVDLWENTNLTASFEGQEVTLSDIPNNYKYIVVLYIESLAAPHTSVCEEVKCSFDDIVTGIIFTEATHNISGSSSFYRNGGLTANSTTAIFYNGFSNDGVIANDHLIPYKIIGIKEVSQENKEGK